MLYSLLLIMINFPNSLVKNTEMTAIEKADYNLC